METAIALFFVVVALVGIALLPRFKTVHGNSPLTLLLAVELVLILVTGLWGAFGGGDG